MDDDSHGVVPSCSRNISCLTRKVTTSWYYLIHISSWYNRPTYLWLNCWVTQTHCSAYLLHAAESLLGS